VNTISSINTNRKLIQVFFICFSFLQCISVSAQADNFQVLINKIQQFSKPARILNKHIDAKGNGPVEFTNAKKQVLRFRLEHHKLQIQHGGIAYQLFYYKNDYLEKIQTFDVNGKLAGEGESKNESGVVFIIEKPNLYLKKKGTH
jgi:hydroxypyruvate isomerase